MNWLQYELVSAARVRAWFRAMPDWGLVLIALSWTIVLVAAWAPILILEALFFLLEPGAPL